MSDFFAQMRHAAKVQQAHEERLIAAGWVRGEGAAHDTWTHPDVDAPIPAMTDMMTAPEFEDTGKGFSNAHQQD
jgi:hypothetical protein